MPTILKHLLSLLPHIPDEAEREEAYLAQSVDLQDFEHRMRALESGMHLGTYDLGLIHAKSMFSPRED